MAYRFQDLDGNWRIRYDDGTTSPVIGNVSGPLRDANFNFSDESVRDIYGVEASTDPKALLRGAIIEQAASQDRIATYQREFDPLAASPQGQDVLIKDVFANPNMDLEARAAAAQALYPGMTAEIGVNGELSFSAKNSDLGFKYPDKTAAQAITERGVNAARATGSSNLEFNDVFSAMSTAIQGMPNEASADSVATTMAEIVKQGTDFKAQRQAFYQNEISRQHNIQGLEEALKQERLLDEQNRLAEPWTAGYGDSEMTKRVYQDLVLAKSARDDDVKLAIEGDSELAQINYLLGRANEISSSITEGILSTPSLVPEEARAILNRYYNDDGTPLTNKQERELSKRIAAGDKATQTFIELLSAPIQQMPVMATELPFSMQKVAGKLFDDAVGEEGVFNRFKEAYTNFDKFVKDNGIILTKEEQDALKAVDGAGSGISDEMKRQRQQEASNVKRIRIESYFKEARDKAGLVTVLSGDSVPENPEVAVMWKDALEAARTAKRDQVDRARTKLENSWAFSAASRLEKMNQLKAFDADAELAKTIDLHDALVAFSGIYSRSSMGSGDISTDAFAANEAIGKWLTAQATVPPMRNWLGENSLLQTSTVQAILMDALAFRKELNLGGPSQSFGGPL